MHMKPLQILSRNGLEANPEPVGLKVRFLPFPAAKHSITSGRRGVFLEESQIVKEHFLLALCARYLIWESLVR